MKEGTDGRRYGEKETGKRRGGKVGKGGRRKEGREGETEGRKTGGRRALWTYLPILLGSVSPLSFVSID
jgi:hypothetical protein